MVPDEKDVLSALYHQFSQQFYGIARYSVHEDEEEVVVAPGTILQVEGIDIKDGWYYIQLRNVYNKDVDFCPEGARQEALQMITDLEFEDKVYLVGLNNEILEPILNSLLQKREHIKTIYISGCDLSCLDMKKFMETLPLLPEIKALKIYSGTINPSLESMLTLAERLPQTLLKKLSVMLYNCYYVAEIFEKFEQKDSLRNLESFTLKLSDEHKEFNQEFISLLFSLLPETKIHELNIQSFFGFHSRPNTCRS